MKRFTTLFCELDRTTRTNEKVAALERYFRDVPSSDAAWALHFLSGRSWPRAVSTKNLWEWTAAETGLPLWIVEECHAAVGDTAETIALLITSPGSGSPLALAELVEHRYLPLKALPEGARRELLVQTWRELTINERFVWNKLITGNFRTGVARTLVIRALAQIAGIEPALMAHRIIGAWKPTAKDFLGMMSGEPGGFAKPYPFYLASPIELYVSKDEDLTNFGPLSEWFVEWKWDGIRAQLIHREGETLIWSRGDEMISEAFPELIETGHCLPDGTVLDGEILAWKGETPLPFAQLQRRLGRKKVAQRTRTDFPVTFVAYDILEYARNDIRAEPLEMRRRTLEAVLAVASRHLTVSTSKVSSVYAETPMLPGVEPDVRPVPLNSPLRLSTLVDAPSWRHLTELHFTSRSRGVEGLMLKRRSSSYGVGRQRGNWWKWKIEPLVIDAVLILAQRGSGRRANLYTDYTFGLWDRGKLVPIAKAYSGLTDAEIVQVDAFVRRNSKERFGPVRIVKPELIFELAFEGIQRSNRHKAGVAVRFPRINRWRHDKKPEDADTLENLRSLATFGGNPS